MVDSSIGVLRLQADLARRMGPELRCARAFAWSSEMLNASREAYLNRCGGDRDFALECWVGLQYGEDAAKGYAHARKARAQQAIEWPQLKRRSRREPLST